MSGPDTMTLNPNLADPENRAALYAAARALEQIELHCAPPRSGGGEMPQGKPEGKAPAGDRRALSVAKRARRNLDAIVAMASELKEERQYTPEERAVVDTEQARIDQERRQRGAVQRAMKAGLVHTVSGD